MTKNTYADRNCTSNEKITPDVGDSLYNNIDKKLYLILMVDYKKKIITLTDTKDNKINIGTDAQTLSNFKLIKSHD